MLEAERPSRYVFGWQAGLGGTIVELDLCSTGWGEALTLLKFWVEHGVAY